MFALGSGVMVALESLGSLELALDGSISKVIVDSAGICSRVISTRVSGVAIKTPSLVVADGL